MKFNKTSSRRNVLQTVVFSALMSAAPLSVLDAATGAGYPSVIDLTDGSSLEITKVGDKQFKAVRKQGDKVVDEKPTGRFDAKNGSVIVLDQGKVKSVQSVNRDASDWFLAFDK